MSKFVDKEHPLWARHEAHPDLPENKWIFRKVLDMVEKELKPDAAGITRWLIRGYDKLKVTEGAFTKLPAVMVDFKAGMLSLTSSLREWLLGQMEDLGADCPDEPGGLGPQRIDLLAVWKLYNDKRHGPLGQKISRLELFDSIRVLVDGVQKTHPNWTYIPSRTNPSERAAGTFYVKKWRLQGEDNEEDHGFNRGMSGFH
jgi:hypothetical protein